MDQPITFRFRFVKTNGSSTLGKPRGSFDGETLTLGKEPSISADRIARVERAGANLVILVQDPSGEGLAYTLSGIPKKIAAQLRSALLLSSSSHRAQIHQEELEARGQGDQFKIAVCHHCEATIDRSGCDESIQSYCQYCDSISTAHDEVPKDEGTYHTCECCGLYSQPREYTIAYFVFLLYFFYARWKQVRMCHVCIRREAWKMLAGNLLFVILVPVAVVQLCRAYFGGSAKSASFAGLDAANALARKGRVDDAGRAFDIIADRLPAAAGVHFNHAMAKILANDVNGAARQFERSLQDCANFGPSLNGLWQCYQMQGDPEKLKALEMKLGMMGIDLDRPASDQDISDPEPARLAA